MKNYFFITAVLSCFIILSLSFLTACSGQETDGQPRQTQADMQDTQSTAPAIPAETEPQQTSASVTEQQTAPPETESVPVDLNVYFENNLFIGDSILEGLAQYVRAQRQAGTEMLSDAKFLTSIMGIRVADLVGDTKEYERVRYQYRGAVRELEEIVSLAAPKRVFFLLGMNDLAGGASVEDTVSRYDRLLTQIQNTFSDLNIVVLTPTPKTSSTWLPDYCTNPDFASPLLREFADALLALCETKGITCVDVFAVLADENGHLPDSFSRDNYVHINDLGAAPVVDALNRFAQEDIG